MSDLGKDGYSPKETTEYHAEKARRGDSAAFARLYEKLASSLDAWAQLRVSGSLRDFVEPADVVQEVWWRAMDAFDRYNPEKTNFRPWIFTIATNVLLEWNRNRRRKLRIAPRSLADRAGSLPPELKRQATSVGRGVVINESVKSLVGLVLKLSDDERALFIHCGLEGLTAAEASVLVGVSPDTVNKRWQRLRGKLSQNAIWHEFEY